MAYNQNNTHAVDYFLDGFVETITNTQGSFKLLYQNSDGLLAVWHRYEFKGIDNNTEVSEENFAFSEFLNAEGYYNSIVITYSPYVPI